MLAVSSVQAPVDRRPLLIILIASIVQGWALYGLYLTIEHHRWPATHLEWLLGLYALAVYVPSTVQLVASLLPSRAATLPLIVLAVLYFYFGWFEGADLLQGSGEQPLARSYDTLFPMALQLLLLWLLAMPFIQCRITTGRWLPAYAHFFSHAWRNKIVLAEAALFTGIFWLLLLLWQQLFYLLGIAFFRELFQRAIFVYPVTALVFGFGIFLVGSLEHWVSVVLDQLLNLLKWLGVIAAGLLALFTLTLLFKLGTLFTSGKRVIDAQWLLWLVAVVVLFTNAAYRDGSVTAPYPRLVATALRYVMPLLTIVAATAAYALLVRTQRYGFTVERVWAFVVAGFAVLYAGGYCYAAFATEPWMSRIAPVNIACALCMMAVLVLTLSPALSPYRVAANSQFQRELHWQGPVASKDRLAESPFLYLRFHAGAYGLQRLHQLTDGNDAAVNATIREQAAAAVAQPSEWLAPAPTAVNLDGNLSRLPLFPSGSLISPALRDAVIDDLRHANSATGLYVTPSALMAGLFIDLNADGNDEFVLFINISAVRVYQRSGEGWKYAGSMSGTQTPIGRDQEAELIGKLSAGEIAALPQHWADLKVGNDTYRFSNDPDRSTNRNPVARAK